jgi:hypothetical protein
MPRHFMQCFCRWLIKFTPPDGPAGHADDLRRRQVLLPFRPRLEGCSRRLFFPLAVPPPSSFEFTRSGLESCNCSLKVSTISRLLIKTSFLEINQVYPEDLEAKLINITTIYNDN